MSLQQDPPVVQFQVAQRVEDLLNALTVTVQ